MNILITLDYELFFGESGTPEKCIIEPTNRLLLIAEEFDFKCVFFVDAGYLVKLKKSFVKFPELKRDYEIVTDQIKQLVSLGHEIQLHIHPHWEDSFYDGSTWKFNLSRFRMGSFDEPEIDVIFRTYKEELESISGQQIFAYRAGGWCIQPFNTFVKSFVKYGIKIDSTVFYKGKNSTATQWYDFDCAPNKSQWNFDVDPCKEVKTGRFMEIPISSIRVSPLFYWRFVYKKLWGSPKYRSIGDGVSSKSSRIQQIRLMLFPSYSVVSMDGYKSSLLHKAFKKHRHENFVVIGHPKAFTEDSLDRFRDFIIQVKSMKGNSIITYSKMLEKFNSTKKIE